MGWLQADLPYEVIEDELLAPIRGVEMTDVETLVATLLLRHTSEVPIKIAGVIAAAEARYFTLNDRQVKAIIRGFRRDRTFPICSRKSKPAGYWWGRTEAELEEFITSWKSQYLDEAKTLSLMIKANYPRLAGQLKLALEE